jgi:hypothetical protein
MQGYMPNPGPRPALFLVLILLVLGVCIFVGSVKGLIGDTSTVTQPGATQAAPAQAKPISPTPAAPTPDATLIQQYVEATVGVKVAELQIAQGKAAAASDAAAAEQDKAAAVATYIAGQILFVDTQSTRVANDKAEQAVVQARADTRNNTLVAYGIVVLCIAAGSGILAIALALLIERLQEIRRRQKEAAAQLTQEQAMLVKNTPPLRGPEKSYQDLPTIWNPHPLEDGSSKERDRITKRSPTPERRPNRPEKEYKKILPGTDE